MSFVISDKPNDRVDQGVWVEYEGSRFLLAAAGNDNFIRRMTALRKPYRRQEERGDGIDPAKLRQITIQATAETVLLNWEGVKVQQNGEAVDLPYSVKAAVQALTNSIPFRNWVMEFSMDMQNFIVEAEEIEGNS